MSDIEKQESESCWKNSWKPLGSLPVSYFFMFSRASGLDVKEMVSKAAITFKIIIIGSSCHPWMTRLRTRNQNSIISEIDSSDKSNDISTLRQITHKKSVVETLKLIALLVIINVAICLHHCSSSFIITNHCWNYCHPPPPCFRTSSKSGGIGNSTWQVSLHSQTYLQAWGLWTGYIKW